MKRKIFLFFHVEKCGGTSLVNFFRNNYPLQACEAVSKSNRLQKTELKTILFCYPRIKVLSGHNLHTDVIDWLLDAGFEVYSFTLLRNPVERLISDYLHDHRKGTFGGTLCDYSSIAWKKNYISRFFGAGAAESGARNISRLDCVMPLWKSEDFARLLVTSELGHINSPYIKSNTSGSTLPSDVQQSDGVRVGSYEISRKAYDLIVEGNEIDIQLFEVFRTSTFEIEGVNEKTVGSSCTRFLGKWRGLRTAARIQRNILYKPLVGVTPGYYALPRNADDPRLVDEKDAFN